MPKIFLVGLISAAFVLVGCGNGDTTGGAAESAAELAQKSANAKPLSERDQTALSKASMPGGKKGK